MGIKGTMPAIVLACCCVFAAVNAAALESSNRKILQSRGKSASLSLLGPQAREPSPINVFFQLLYIFLHLESILAVSAWPIHPSRLLLTLSPSLLLLLLCLQSQCTPVTALQRSMLWMIVIHTRWAILFVSLSGPKLRMVAPGSQHAVSAFATDGGSWGGWGMQQQLFESLEA
jgi:hypothetical protein